MLNWTEILIDQNTASNFLRISVGLMAICITLVGILAVFLQRQEREADKTGTGSLKRELIQKALKGLATLCFPCFFVSTISAVAWSFIIRMISDLSWAHYAFGLISIICFLFGTFSIFIIGIKNFRMF